MKIKIAIKWQCVFVTVFCTILLIPLTACMGFSADNAKGGGDALYITAPSIEQLTQNTSLIVIGEVTDIGLEFNIARDVNEISKPDQNVYVIGQAYQFSVDRYLKGDGETIINIVQSEGILGEETPKTSEEKQKAREIFKHIEIKKNTKYLLFLDPLIGFPKGEYYIGNMQPWLFDLTNSLAVVPDSPWPGAKTAFPPTSLDQISKIVQKYSQMTPTAPGG
ncbi:MAG: hypothetical protein PHQ40_16155 [Anaerolineaceae bacterium]|nr:hypothetical protein [Anaerolineaceae bacterium]